MNDAGRLSTYDGLAGVVIGLFVLACILHGHGENLLAALKQETGFIKWAAALLILRFLAATDTMGSAGTLLISGVYILLAMKVVTNKQVMAGIAGAWSKL